MFLLISIERGLYLWMDARTENKDDLKCYRPDSNDRKNNTNRNLAKYHIVRYGYFI